jgi:hypothetical protein
VFGRFSSVVNGHPFLTLGRCVLNGMR